MSADRAADPRRSSTRPVARGRPRPARAPRCATSAPAGPVAVRLTEVEAYAGERGPRLARLPRPTPRTAVMFGPPGRALRLLHLRHALVHEPRLRAGGRGLRGAAAGRRGGRGRGPGHAPAVRGTYAARPGPRPGPADAWPSASTAATTAPTPPTRTSCLTVHAGAGHDGPAVPDRPAGRGRRGRRRRTRGGSGWRTSRACRRTGRRYRVAVVPASRGCWAGTVPTRERHETHVTAADELLDDLHGAA